MTYNKYDFMMSYNPLYYISVPVYIFVIKIIVENTCNNDNIIRKVVRLL